MNQCRICWKNIQRMFNWWPALRCASCRAIKDDELATAIEDTIDVFNESESAIEDAKRLSMRNKLLRQRNQVLLNDNKRLETDNERLRKWTERLFARINELEKTIEEKDVLLESKREEVNILMNKNADMKKIFTEECEKMRKENVDLNKKVEEQYYTIQQYEQWFANWSYHWEE